MPKKTISVQLEPDLIEALDARRGSIPRQRVIAGLIEGFLAGTDRRSELPVVPSAPVRQSKPRELPALAHRQTCRCPVCKPERIGKGKAVIAEAEARTRERWR